MGAFVSVWPWLNEFSRVVLSCSNGSNGAVLSCFTGPGFSELGSIIPNCLTLSLPTAFTADKIGRLVQTIAQGKFIQCYGYKETRE